jgi:hypothetical protein
MLALFSGVVIWGFGVEVSAALDPSTAFVPMNLILALVTLLPGGFLALLFGRHLALPPVHGRLLRVLAVAVRALPVLMVVCNSLALLVAADKPPLIFTISAWAALACFESSFLAATAFGLVYAAQNRKVGGQGSPPPSWSGEQRGTS